MQILRLLVYSLPTEIFVLVKNVCIKVYIKKTVKSALPDPKGPLVEEIPSSLISVANKEVLEIKPLTARHIGLGIGEEACSLHQDHSRWQ